MSIKREKIKQEIIASFKRNVRVVPRDGCLELFIGPEEELNIVVLTPPVRK